MWLKTLPFFLSLFNLYACNVLHGGILYPRESESRQIQELNGMWNFRADRSSCRCSGLEEKWFRQPLSKTGPVISMPVPSSYNDITTQKSLRDFVGWVWYDREMFVSPDWKNKRVILRIDSAHYYSKVWMNGKPVMDHNGGHLPFEAVVNTHLFYGQPNIITIAVNNTLLPHTLPPGSLTFQHDTQRYPKGYFVQNLQFDFFNYAGIHRRVRLYTTPVTYVDDITINTNIEGNSGIVKYVVDVVGKYGTIVVDILDRNGTSVGSLQALNGAIVVKKPVLWWPYTMNSEAGYLYTLKVTLTGTDGTVDVYRQPFGIRTINVTATQILINEKPFYCHGAAKHEDSDIRGKGLDFALIARDFHMMKWLGINCFRTSHYPYAEEIMDEADKEGIVVIDECPGVGITKKENFGNASLSHHLEVMEELVRRDKNRPSVIMWSVANEPASNLPEADFYFKPNTQMYSVSTAIMVGIRTLDTPRLYRIS